MKPAPFLSIVFLLVLALSACSVPATPNTPLTPPPPNTTEDPGSAATYGDWIRSLEPGDILFQSTYEPTYFRPETFYVFGVFPPFTLYADGTIIYIDEGQTFEDQAIMETRLSPEETETLYTSLIRSGFADLESHLDFCQDQSDGSSMCIADASYTIFSGLLPGGRPHFVKIYAEFANNPDTFTEILDLTTGYTHPDARRYVPTQATLFVRPLDEAIGVTVQDWPLDPAMLAGINYQDSGLWAMILEGQDLELFLESAPQNTGDLFFALNGQEYGTFFVPWLPGSDFTAQIEAEFPPLAPPYPVEDETILPAYPSLSPELCPVTESLPSGPIRLSYLMDGDVWVWDEGTEPISLTGTGDALDLVLTPEGNTVLYILQPEDGVQSLWAGAADQSFTRPLTEPGGLPGDIQLHSFSFDGTMVAFTLLTDEMSGELWVANLDGSGAQRLVNTEDLMAIVAEPLAESSIPAGVTWIPGTYTLTYDARPTFSDGIYIYVQEQVWIVDALSGDQSERFPLGEGGNVSYSPDGTILVLTTPDRLHWMNLEEGVLHTPEIGYQQVGMGEFYAAPPLVWTPDSQSFYTAIPEPAGNATNILPVTVWHVLVDGSAAERLGSFEGFFPSFTFAPTADKLVYWRTDEPLSNSRELRITTLDGSEEIVYASGGLLEFLGWAPDGQFFLYGSFQVRQGFVGNACFNTEPIPFPNNLFPFGARWADTTQFLFERLDESSGLYEIYLGTVRGDSVLKLNTESNSRYDFTLLGPG